MQKEAYYEESAVSSRSVSEAKLYRVCQIIGAVFLCITFLQLLFTVSYVSSQQTLLVDGKIDKLTFIFAVVEWFVFVLCSIGIFFFFFFFKKRFNASYDYCFVEDELRVSKVFNGRKRKQIKKIETERILKVGWAKNDSFKRTIAGYTKKNIVYLTPNKQPAEGKEFFYLVYSSSIEKKVYIIEARTEMLDYIVRAAGINKLERN